MSWQQDPSYFALKRFIVESTGLDYYTQKDDDFFNRLGRRLAEAGKRDCADYLLYLQQNAAELDALINELTIGETYFYRHQEQYDALQKTVLPELIRQNQLTRRIQVWSAGCSIGPEPYSVAMLWDDHFSTLAENWVLTVVGTDINREALRKARQGEYEEWSLRSLALPIRDKYFRKEGRKFFLDNRIKQAVSFQFHNLVEEPFAPPPDLLGNLDLIICRNVTIYFDARTCARLIQRFEDLLAPGGWLIVGHSEPNLEYFQRFETVQTPGAILYRKPSLLSTAAQVSKPVLMPALAPLPKPGDLPGPALAERAPRPSSQVPETIQSHLDRGAFEKALVLCDRRLKLDGLNAGLFQQRGKILEELQRSSEAEAAYKKCLYLSRDHVLGHFFLGSLLLRAGKAAPARRHFETVLRLLEILPDGHALPEGNGLTAGELKAMARMHMEAA